MHVYYILQLLHINRTSFYVFFCFDFEVSSSDDEGTLSGMEKLVNSLDKLTKLILESLKATDTSKQSGDVKWT